MNAPPGSVESIFVNSLGVSGGSGVQKKEG